MADQRPVEKLTFNFASRTFANRTLAQGLSKSLSAFCSFMREFLDSVIKADQDGKHADIGIAANSPEQLITTLRAVFKCIQNAGIRLFVAKCQFGRKEVYFLGRTITRKGFSPQKQTITSFLEKVKFPRRKKSIKTIHWQKDDKLALSNKTKSFLPTS